ADRALCGERGPGANEQRQELGRAAGPPRELARTGERVRDVVCPVALRRGQYLPHENLQLQRLLHAPRRVGERTEQLERRREVTGGFAQRRACDGELASSLPLSPCRLELARFGEVVSEQLRHRFHGIRKAVGEGSCDGDVQLAAATREERAVRRGPADRGPEDIR